MSSKPSPPPRPPQGKGSPVARSRERPGRRVVPAGSAVGDKSSLPESRDPVLAFFESFSTSDDGQMSSSDVMRLTNRVFADFDSPDIGSLSINKLGRVIFASLDTNRSGSVSATEFCNWVKKGSQLGPAERAAFAESGPVQASILTFLDAVNALVKEQISEDQAAKSDANDTSDGEARSQEDLQSRLIERVDEVVADIFKQFDADGDSHLTGEEMAAMLLELCLSQGRDTDHGTATTAATKVMAIMDADDSGTLEPEEMASWLREGLTLTPEERRTMAQTGPAQATLVRFLASIEEAYGLRRLSNLSASQLRGDVLNASAAIFKRYDIDGSGAIDGDELRDMIRGVSEAQDAKSFDNQSTALLDDAVTHIMETMTRGKSELLTLEMFTAWVQEGLKLTPKQRRQFASKAPHTTIMVRFLRAIEEKLSSPEESSDSDSIDAQLNRAIRQLFLEYDADGSGAIDVQEMTSMITEIQMQDGVALEHVDYTQSQEAARNVMVMLLGPDGSSPDALLTVSAFRGWLRKGLLMTSKQREIFARAKPVNAVLCRFLRAVERLARQYTAATPLSRAVSSIFTKYDVDGSGMVDVNELSQAIVELVSDDGGSIETEDAATAARQVMTMLNPDATGRERVSESDFLGWIHKGTKMDGKTRRNFAKTSEPRRIMILLLRAVESRAAQESWDGSRRCLHKLFLKYDADGSGHIDMDELAAMMTEMLMDNDIIISHDLSARCATAIIKHMDTSGNDLLEEDEFVQWVQKGTEMSKGDRQQLRSADEAKALLVDFLEAVEAKMAAATS